MGGGDERLVDSSLTVSFVSKEIITKDKAQISQKKIEKSFVIC